MNKWPLNLIWAVPIFLLGSIALGFTIGSFLLIERSRPRKRWQAPDYPMDIVGAGR